MLQICRVDLTCWNFDKREIKICAQKESVELKIVRAEIKIQINEF